MDVPKAKAHDTHGHCLTQCVEQHLPAQTKNSLASNILQRIVIAANNGILQRQR